MADLAGLKQLVTDLMLGSKQFNGAAQLGEMLKGYDPDLKVTHDSLANQTLIDAVVARRAALATPFTDLQRTAALAETHGRSLTAIPKIVNEMKAAKVKGSSVPAEYVTKLTAARKTDVARLEGDRIQPAIVKFVKKHQELYTFVGGILTNKAAAAKPAPPPIDPKLMAKATKDTDEIMTVLGNRDLLFGRASPLDQGSLRTFAQDKLSFLPNAVRGFDTKQLHAEEKLTVEAARQFEAEYLKGARIVNDAHDTFKHQGKAFRGGGLPLLVWKKRSDVVALRDRLVKLLKNFCQHLDLWMSQKTTARLDLKSKKVIAGVRLKDQAEMLIRTYQKVI